MLPRQAPAGCIMRETAGTRTVSGLTNAVVVGVVTPGSAVKTVRVRKSTTTLNPVFQEMATYFPVSDYAT